MRIATAALALALAPSAAIAGPCTQWLPPERVGTLDPQFLTEESGIAASRVHPDRLYHNNDSGDGPFFYVTNGSGAATRRVAVTGFVPRDVEDIALGACAGAASCLFLGDIGDNAGTRSSVTFVEVAEQDAFPDEVAPLRMVEARYPDGPHNAEGFAIHPNGDLYLITKNLELATRSSGPAGIYRLSAAALASADGRVLTFEPVGTLDLPALVADIFMNQVATAMDISADGKRVLLLTYRNLVEWNEDLADGLDPGARPEFGRDYTLTPIAPLIQAEAIAYLAEGDGVIYTTELARPATEAPLFRQTCARR